MRILLTGHEGYIGAVMAPALRMAGHEVDGADAGYYEGCDLGPRSAGSGVGHGRRLDIRDLSVADLHGYHAVIHLAALCNDPLGDLNPAWTYDINFGATVELARKAREAGVARFLFASSCSVYGDAGTDDELTEATAPSPLTPYAISKAQAEAAVAQLADSSFSPVFLRNGSVYGLSPRFRADIVLNNLVCWAVTTGQVTLLTDGSPWRPLVHVEDVAAVFALALTAPREAIHNEVFNVGIPGDNFQVGELAEIVRATITDSRIVHVPHAGGDTRDYRVSFAKLRATFPGFNARWTVRRGAEQVRDGVRNARMTLAQFQGARHTRLVRLRELIDAGRVDESLRMRPTGRPVPIQA